MLRGFVLIAAMASTAVNADVETVSPDSPSTRRPVAAGLTSGGGRLWVANERSGSLSIVDVESHEVAAEFRVGRSLSAAASLPDSDRLLLCDHADHRLVMVDIDGDRPVELASTAVSDHPVHVTTTRDGQYAFVTSLWSRTLSTILVAADGDKAELSVVKTLPLPFAPREQIVLDDHNTLIVADAFAGRLAVVDIPSGRLVRVAELPAHNIRGLALSRDGERLFVSHQIANELTPPRTSDIIWGVFMTNGIRLLRIENLVDPDVSFLKGSRFIPLGDGGRGAGDPDSLVVDDNGRIIVTLAGISEVGILGDDGYDLQRIPVGRRPTAVVPDTQHERWFVVNSLDDSVTVVALRANDSGDVAAPDKDEYDERYGARGTYSVRRDGSRDSLFVARPISLGTSPEPDAVTRGERLFFDARLSHGNWYSCHSCHTDGHSNGQLADTLGDGAYGAPKRVLSLLGVSETGPWAWTGSMPKLQGQIHSSVKKTMQGHGINDDQADDIMAYLKTLAPPPPLSPAASESDRAVIKRGRAIFARHGCAKCHAGTVLTSAQTYDVGLQDDLGNDRFSPPSLRGVSQRYGFFHDRRATDLKAVLTDVAHQTDGLNDEEIADLLRFLQSL